MRVDGGESARRSLFGPTFFNVTRQLVAPIRSDWGTMSAGIRGLVAFWSSYARRWRRIRAKIFIRTDLFQRHATAGGADQIGLGNHERWHSWTSCFLVELCA